MSSIVVRATTAVLAVSIAFVGGCDRSPVDTPGHDSLGRVEISDLTVTPQVTLASWTHDAGWDRDVLTTLSHGAADERPHIALGVEMWTQGGEEIELIEGGANEAQYGVTDPDDIINMDPALDLFHGDVVHVYGYDDPARTGAAELVFALWHGNHDDGVTDPITLIIAD